MNVAMKQMTRGQILKHTRTAFFLVHKGSNISCRVTKKNLRAAFRDARRNIFTCSVLEEQTTKRKYSETEKRYNEVPVSRYTIGIYLQ